jgi:hypothetical protein
MRMDFMEELPAPGCAYEAPAIRNIIASIHTDVLFIVIHLDLV